MKMNDNYDDDDDGDDDDDDDDDDAHNLSPKGIIKRSHASDDFLNDPLNFRHTMPHVHARTHAFSSLRWSGLVYSVVISGEPVIVNIARDSWQPDMARTLRHSNVSGALC